jgi:hypothetical protein
MRHMFETPDETESVLFNALPSPRQARHFQRVSASLHCRSYQQVGNVTSCTFFIILFSKFIEWRGLQGKPSFTQSLISPLFGCTKSSRGTTSRKIHLAHERRLIDLKIKATCREREMKASSLSATSLQCTGSITFVEHMQENEQKQ